MKVLVPRVAVAALCVAAVHAGPKPLQAQNDSPLILGQLTTGGTVSFTRGPDDWGIRIQNPGRASMMQAHPVQLRTLEDSVPIATGYSSITRVGDAVVGRGQLTPASGVVIAFEDHWSLDGAALRVERDVAVDGSAPGGFASMLALSTAEGFTFPELDLFFPGMIYSGWPERIADRAPAGMPNFLAGAIQEREDGFTMPIFGFSFRDGRSIAVLNPSPDGRTVIADTRSRSGPPVINDRMRFGGMGAFENDAGGVDVAYWYPGSLPAAQRYHPYLDGLTQSYRLAFRFGEDETFHDFYTHAWRWGWNELDPQPDHYDLDVVQRVLVDNLAGNIEYRQDWAALPFMRSIMTGEVAVESSPENCHTPARWCDEQPGEYRWSRAIMGFVGKNLEAASEILYDSYQDDTARGREHRQAAIDVIDSFVRKVEVAPPNGSGFNVETGEPSMTNPEGNHITCCSGRVYLREFAEDMRWVLWAYEWELDRDTEHAHWLDWMVRFADWALTQQGDDGSFPRSFYVPSGEVRDTSTTSGYFMVNFLVKLSQVTDEPHYLESAERAADYVWARFHRNDHFIGGPIDNPNTMDKEAATLALGGYLALYEATGAPRWLRYAKAAADFAETWVYAWNVPMPEDENPDSLHWKPGAPTLGVNRINAAFTGVDQWMSADADEYARLYQHTGDEHYLEVARVLLHATKAMLALPDRPYDVLAPGWQQEHWRMTFGRGYGGHRNAFPWVSANHLNGLLSLQIFVPELYEELARPARSSGAP